MSSSETNSQGTSSSSSISQPIQTPENDIINNISGVASSLANQMVSWAQGVFAQTSAITNQAVGNFFTVSQNMLGLSSNLTSQYNNLFAPENAQLVADANSYNSAARQAVDMGMAGATQAEAGSAALANSEAALRSYGINPADGRYAALDEAANVQNGANIAGAENMQRVSDTTTGQNLRQAAVNVGAQLPAAIANINNTAIQANTGAANATDANANTGANLMALPNKYLDTAMQVKMPFQGTIGQSQSNNRSQGQGAQPGQGQGNGSGNGGNNGGGNSPSNMNPALYTQPSITGNPTGTQRGAAIMQVPNTATENTFDYSDPTGQNYDPLGAAGITADDFTGGEGSMGIGQPGAGFGDGTDFGVGAGDVYGGDTGVGSEGMGMFGQDTGGGGFGQTLDPTSQLGGGQADNTYGNMGGGTDTPYGNISYDPSANQGSGFTDPSTAAPPDSSGSAPSPDMGSSDDFARGGAIPNVPPAHAGPIPASMSPSGGRKVDDIKAKGPGGANLRMNANEFVIPQDVALWKGQEFFQNLIDQSRKKRMMASAHGQVKPAGPPQHALHPALAQRRVTPQPQPQV